MVDGFPFHPCELWNPLHNCCECISICSLRTFDLNECIFFRFATFCTSTERYQKIRRSTQMQGTRSGTQPCIHSRVKTSHKVTKAYLICLHMLLTICLDDNCRREKNGTTKQKRREGKEDARVFLLKGPNLKRNWL